MAWRWYSNKSQIQEKNMNILSWCGGVSFSICLHVPVFVFSFSKFIWRWWFKVWPSKHKQSRLSPSIYKINNRIFRLQTCGVPCKCYSINNLIILKLVISVPFCVVCIADTDVPTMYCTLKSTQGCQNHGVTRTINMKLKTLAGQLEENIVKDAWYIFSACILCILWKLK